MKSKMAGQYSLAKESPIAKFPTKIYATSLFNKLNLTLKHGSHRVIANSSSCQYTLLSSNSLLRVNWKHKLLNPISRAPQKVLFNSSPNSRFLHTNLFNYSISKVKLWSHVKISLSWKFHSPIQQSDWIKRKWIPPNQLQFNNSHTNARFFQFAEICTKSTKSMPLESNNLHRLQLHRTTPNLCSRVAMNLNTVVWTNCLYQNGIINTLIAIANQFSFKFSNVTLSEHSCFTQFFAHVQFVSTKSIFCTVTI